MRYLLPVIGSPDLSVNDHVLLYVTTLITGFLNATVGGGGLLQIPMLMLVLPQTPLPALIGTAKVAGFPGLVGAVITFARKLKPAWPLILRASATAVPCAVLGASLATRLDPAWARPIILTVLTLMAAQVLLHRGFGERAPGPPRWLTGPMPWIAGALIGLYEGFLGSGSGTILIVLFVTMNGLDMVGASVASAMITCAGVAAAVVTFAAARSVVMPLAVQMAAFNIVGSLLGARVVTFKGNVVLRRMLGVVLLLLIARIAWDIFKPA